MTKKIIALPDASDHDLAGAIVFTYRAAPVQGDVINAALREIGMPEEDLLEAPSPADALRRTMQQHTTPTVFLRRSQGSFWLVQEVGLGTAEGSPWAGFQALARGETVGGNPRFEVGAGGLSVEQLEDDFWGHLTSWTVTGTEVSQWVIRLLHKLDGISLRQRGSIYFIPRTGVERWKEVSAVLHAHSPCRIRTIPAITDTNTLEYVVDGLLDAALSFSDKLQEELGSLGNKALKNREAEAQELLRKLHRYRDVLGALGQQKMAEVEARVRQSTLDVIQTALVSAPTIG